MTTPPVECLAGYEAALESAVFVARTDAHYLSISGEDRVDFLHRQTTNDIGLLGPERAVVTVLTSPNARIYDALLLVEEPEAIGVVTLPGRGPATAAFLQSRIFFMDKVAVSDDSSEWAQFDLEGPQAGNVLADLGLAQAPGLDGVASIELDGAAVRVIGREGLAGAGYRMLVPVADSERLTNALVERGVPPLSLEAYDVLRVEAGLPGPGELTEDYTPLEINLARTISETKGCYTGQEVIARQITYDKVTKTLVGLRLEASVTVGAQTNADGKAVGTVTSAVQSPRYGPIALAVVRRGHTDVGTRLTVEQDGQTIASEVASLPFTS